MITPHLCEQTDNNKQISTKPQLWRTPPLQISRQIMLSPLSNCILVKTPLLRAWFEHKGRDYKNSYAVLFHDQYIYMHQVVPHERVDEAIYYHVWEFDNCWQGLWVSKQSCKNVWQHNTIPISWQWMSKHGLLGVIRIASMWRIRIRGQIFDGLLIDSSVFIDTGVYQHNMHELVRTYF